MLRRFLTPRWIVGHLLVLVVVGVFIRLGIWQLDRLSERRALNDTVSARLALPTTDLRDLLDGASPDEWEHRAAVVQGTFDVKEEILIRSRTSNGEAGFHVVTPLVIGDDVAVLINRGWVPLEYDDPPVTPALPVAGLTEVTGTVRVSQPAPILGPRDPSAGILERMYWIDIPRIQQQSSYALLPVSLQLQVQVPGQIGPLPVPVPPLDLTEGSHLAYSVQWFAFALIGMGGYVALLRRSGRGAGVGESDGVG